MKILLSLVLLFSIPTAALAQSVPTPDVMGAFFDPYYPAQEGTVPPFTPFTVYVVLMNPTQAVINGFEYGYDHWVSPENEGMVFRTATNFPPGIILINPPFDPFQGSYVISLPEPVPVGTYNVLMSWEYMLMGNFEMHFDIVAAEATAMPGGLPGYWTGSELVPCGPAETCWGRGSRMNAFCPLAVEAHTWGTLKGLYR